VTSAGIDRLLRRSGDTLGVPAKAGLSVRLTDDAELRELNARFLNDNRSTDVLAFPAGTELGPAGRDIPRVGDIAISVERAIQQSLDPASELRLLAVHGLLHCLGYDHLERVDAAKMIAVTRSLLPDQNVPDL
jgi:probable rRNA maturation factor